MIAWWVKWRWGEWWGLSGHNILHAGGGWRYPRNLLFQWWKSGGLKCIAGKHIRNAIDFHCKITIILLLKQAFNKKSCHETFGWISSVALRTLPLKSFHCVVNIISKACKYYSEERNIWLPPQKSNPKWSGLSKKNVILRTLTNLSKCAEAFSLVYSRPAGTIQYVSLDVSKPYLNNNYGKFFAWR